MKKLITTIMIAIMAVMALTACSSDGSAVEEPGQPPEVVEENEEKTDDETNIDDEAKLNASYSLSDLMYNNPDTGEWVSADFVPGAEKYVFHEDNTFEYIYKNYPTYEDMLADSNYEMVTKEGTYSFDSGDSVVSMTMETMQLSGTIDGDQLIIELEDNGMSAVRSIYTLE